ncbi:MAG: M20 family metallopeptidase [Candidatus Limnocylindrales bacterium]
MDAKRLKDRIAARIDDLSTSLDQVALRIHAHPETAYEERFAAAAFAELLRANDRPMVAPIAGVETAFSSEIRGDKNGKGPVVAILAEYDALPGVGHGCGHNLIGTAAAGAFLGLAEVIDELRGTVRLYGTPAEERGAGKVKLLDAGLFRDVDVAMMFHPADHDVADPLMLALSVLHIEFRGTAAHAAAAPSMGVNALDGLLLGWTAMSALRQLVRADSRIHGIITNGGQAANIIPERAAAMIIVRAADPVYLAELRERVLACFQGAARATGGELVYEWGETMDRVTTNPPLGAAFAANAASLGRAMGPRRPGETSGSTDMGNVSSAVPSIHPFLAISSERVPWHSHAFAAAAREPAALEAMHVAAKALAFTAVDVLTRPELLREANEAHANRVTAA